MHLDDLNESLQVNDEIRVKVKKVTDEEVVVSKKDVDAEAAWDRIVEKFESGEVFEVMVKDKVKGGLVVDIGIRGFIPASLVESHFVEDFSSYLNNPITVKVVEIDREKNRVILSHKAVVEEEMSAKKSETLESLEVGQVIEGTVQRLTDFGAFVDIGGVDGLVHISEMAHSRVEKPSDVVTEGDRIKVKVLGLDLDNEKVKLSIKETQPGPWETIEGKIQPGDVIEGTVKRLVTFGAFVEVAPQVEGLLHISQIANRHIATPSEVLSEGQEVKVKVLDVHLDDKKISLSMRALETSEPTRQDDDQALLDEYSDQGGFSVSELTGDDSSDDSK